jgi:hypothetical protein
MYASLADLGAMCHLQMPNSSTTVPNITWLTLRASGTVLPGPTPTLAQKSPIPQRTRTWRALVRTTARQCCRRSLAAVKPTPKYLSWLPQLPRD